MMSEIDGRDPSHTLSKKFGMVPGMPARRLGIDFLGRSRFDVDILVPIDVEQTVQVEDIHLPIQSESDRSRSLAFGHAVIEKFEMHTLVFPKCPSEEQARNA